MSAIEAVKSANKTLGMISIELCATAENFYTKFFIHLLLVHNHVKLLSSIVLFL